jgi:hypothetical protein
VLCNPEGSRPDVLRLVTHLDVTADDIEEAGRRIAHEASTATRDLDKAVRS